MPSKSKQQQKFMGIVRSIQKGDQPASKFSKDAQNAADDMKKKDVEDFASTKHKGLPKKVEQALREKIRTMVEDYVESCGYVVSAKDPNYKLKSPGGTGEEDRELKEEGFGSDEFLTKTEKKKFEKERLENAEVLGYTLTGTKDLKEAVDEGDFISAIQSIQAGLDEAEYGFNDLGRLKGMSSSEKRIVKTLFSRFKVLMRGVEKARRVITTESINEDGHTDVASSKRKVMIMVDDSNKLLNKLNGMNKEDSLPSWWSDKITLSQNYLEKATNYLLNPVESVNEAMSKSQASELLKQLGGNKFISMTGAKNLTFSGLGLVMQIGKNSKGVTHVRFKLSSKDLYDIDFLSIRGSNVKTKSKEKGVYVDQLGKVFKKNTGLKTGLKESVNESKEPEVITQLRDIVKRQTNKKIKDPKTKKTMRVDMFTANAITQVYNAVKKTSHKSKFESLPLDKMAQLSFKMMK